MTCARPKEAWTLWVVGSSPSAQTQHFSCAVPQLKKSKAYSFLTGRLPKPTVRSNRAPTPTKH